MDIILKLKAEKIFIIIYSPIVIYYLLGYLVMLFYRDDVVIFVYSTSLIYLFFLLITIWFLIIGKCLHKYFPNKSKFKFIFIFSIIINISSIMSFLLLYIITYFKGLLFDLMTLIFVTHTILLISIFISIFYISLYLNIIENKKLKILKSIIEALYLYILFPIAIWNVQKRVNLIYENIS